MKKLTRRQFTAAGILAAMSLASASVKSCNPFAPDENEVEAVYGPPEDYEPEENELVDVYGPPPEDVEDGEETEEVDELTYNETINVNPALYGPPEVLSGETDAD